MNRRVADHLNRKAPSEGEGAAPAQIQPAAGSRAAKAAARVAARYAHAPSYGEMLTHEARAAVHAAKAAAQAAQEVQDAFQYVLDGLEAAPKVEPATAQQGPRPERVSPRLISSGLVSPGLVAPASVLRPHRGPSELADAFQGSAGQETARWETANRETADQERANAPFWELEADTQQAAPDLYDAAPRYASSAVNEVEIGEPVQPIYANLIEFPRQLIAARRARPRRAEGPLAAAESAPQLSIFEVDPNTISILPPPATVDPSAPPAWMRPELPDLEAWPASRHLDVPLNLDAQPREELTEDSEHDMPAPQSAVAPAIDLAPFSVRLLAIVVDCALIVAVVIAAAMLAAPHVSHLPGARVAAFGAVLALVAVGFAYHACFLTLARATPGMRYARLEINALSGCAVTRKQRSRRLIAMLLSVLPLGLGFVWMLFDDGNLAWHDRLSKTYLRKR
ncbi:MAG: RDD family protein [Terracidiphilus sp.]